MWVQFWLSLFSFGLVFVKFGSVLVQFGSGLVKFWFSFGAVLVEC